MQDILDASALLHSLPKLIPESNKKLNSPQDAIAALSHTVLCALGFRLNGIDDSSSTSHNATGQLPEDWNKNGPGNYTFRYKHDQSSLEFIVKISKMGSRLLFNAIAIESEKVATLDISTNDFISPSAFPYEIVPTAQPLVHCFISSSRVTDFVSQFKLKIIQNLIPGLRKEGYTETTETAEPTQNRPQNTFDSWRPQPENAEPRVPRYNPDEEFPAFPGRVPSHLPSRNPLEIGRRDLDPIPGGSFQPPALFAPDHGDGMFVGPGHPIFGGRHAQPEARGPWGGDGFLPPMGAPPGARFDPVGPGIGPFPGRLGPAGRGRGNLPGGRNPDNDEFMPPGFNDMYS